MINFCDTSFIIDNESTSNVVYSMSSIFEQQMWTLHPTMTTNQMAERTDHILLEWFRAYVSKFIINLLL